MDKLYIWWVLRTTEHKSKFDLKLFLATQQSKFMGMLDQYWPIYGPNCAIETCHETRDQRGGRLSNPLKNIKFGRLYVVLASNQHYVSHCCLISWVIVPSGYAGWSRRQAFPSTPFTPHIAIRLRDFPEKRTAPKCGWSLLVTVELQ